MEWHVIQNQEGGFSDKIVDDDEDDGTVMMMMETLSFDFRFLDDDDHDFHAIPSSGVTTTTMTNTDDPTVNSSSSWNHHSTGISHGSTSPDTCSQQQSIITDRSDDDDDDDDDEIMTIPHSPTTGTFRQQQASPLAMTSSWSLPYSPHTWSDYRWGQPTNQKSTLIPGMTSRDHVVVDIGPNQRPSCLDTNDDDSWCIKAANRIMISVEVHGKLLMRLRDWNKSPKAHYRSRRSRTDKRGPVPGGMTGPI